MRGSAEEITPVFVLSLPRSGSTLLQRIIATHPEVATASEPWLLLPVLGVQESEFGKTIYGQTLFVDAMRDFIDEMPEKWDTYYAAVRLFAHTLYREVAGDRSCFLDKTPRYHLIASRLIECFPRAKFILLWRNPLAVIGSMLHSYGNVWRMHRFHVDLFRGIEELLRVRARYGELLLVLNYEELVSNPEQSLNRIFGHIGLDVPAGVLKQFAGVELKGTLGDKTGIAGYKTVSSESLEKWQGTLACPIRKAWCRRYLHWVGQDRMSEMGYEFEELMKLLDSVRPSLTETFLSDLVRVPYSELRTRLGGDFC
jgi:Sulfotransferase family